MLFLFLSLLPSVTRSFRLHLSLFPFTTLPLFHSHSHRTLFPSPQLQWSAHINIFLVNELTDWVFQSTKIILYPSILRITFTARINILYTYRYDNDTHVRLLHRNRNTKHVPIIPYIRFVILNRSNTL